MIFILGEGALIFFAVALASNLRGLEQAPAEKIQAVIETAIEDHGLSTSDANTIRENLGSEGICR